MKKIVASLSLAALLLGGSALFAQTPSSDNSKPAASSTTAKSTMTAKKHRKHRKHYKMAKSTTTKPSK